MANVSRRRRLVVDDRRSGRARGGTTAPQRVSPCQPACVAAGPASSRRHAVVAAAVVVAATVGHSGHLASARDRGARDDDDDDDDGDVNIDPTATAAAAAAAAGLHCRLLPAVADSSSIGSNEHGDGIATAVITHSVVRMHDCRCYCLRRGCNAYCCCCCCCCRRQ